MTDIAAVAAQIGSSLMPDNKVWHNRFTVASQTSSAVYTVAQRNTDDTWGCSCRGWIHHRHCKHLTDILARLSALASDMARLSALESSVRQVITSARMAYLDLEVTPLQVQYRGPTRKLDL